jgi:hypothetical protein
MEKVKRKTPTKNLKKKDENNDVAAIQHKIAEAEAASMNPNDFIYSSTNYEEFEFITNRGINPNHLLRIIASMKIRYFKIPISVKVGANGKFGILDGQHRFVACQELGLPVYYVILDDCNTMDIPNINISKQWNTWDFINVYANQGLESYKKILQLKELYPDFKYAKLYLTLTLQKVKTWSGKNTNESSIRTGTFEFPDWDKSIALCEKAMEFKVFSTGKMYDPWKTYPFLSAVVKIIQMPVYDHQQMLKQIMNYSYILEKKSTGKQYIREFTTVYNYNRKLDKVYFENYI